MSSSGLDAEVATLMPPPNASLNGTLDDDGPVMYQSKPAEVVLIAIVGSVVFLVVLAYVSIELTMVSDSISKCEQE